MFFSPVSIWRNKRRRIISENDSNTRIIVYFWIFSFILVCKIYCFTRSFSSVLFCFVLHFSEVHTMFSRHQNDEWWDKRENEISITIVSITKFTAEYSIYKVQSFYRSHCLYAPMHNTLWWKQMHCYLSIWLLFLLFYVVSCDNFKHFTWDSVNGVKCVIISIKID